MTISFDLSPELMSNPVITVDLKKLFDVIKSGFDYYTDTNGKVVFADEGKLCDPDHARRVAETRFLRVSKQLREEKRTHCPTLKVEDGKIILCDGRNRVAALIAAGYENVEVVLTSPHYNPDYDFKQDIVFVKNSIGA
ncbi:hypothetical protein LOC54_01145 [Acetobacter sp. AN02]|uniref:hypothetical protein n=1 Tax=Acetobacter sp. AN02 TaxID=2894186 RepID=UPI0024343C5D|nr:hypothetical protein [Acetobacter sp. AN02]MDG6093729.1 hypothetical protein [Acetobacter sp. AN02]